MIKRRRSPTVMDDITSNVPQNFIPGLTKPRKSTKVEDEDKKLNSICYQGIRLKMKSNPKMSEKLLVRAGLLALSFPAPTLQHSPAEHFAIKSLESKEKGLYQSHSFDNTNGGSEKMNKIVLSRRSTMPAVSQTESNGEKTPLCRARSDTTQSGNSLLEVPGDSNVHIRLDSIPSISSSSSLPELDNLPEEESDDTSAFTIEVPLLEKRRSRSISSGLDYPPEVITSKVKRKLSLALTKKINASKKEEDSFEKEDLETVQKTLRSKLPKTFRVTASMGLYSTISCPKQNKSMNYMPGNQKSRGMRGGSLPAIFRHQLPSANSSSELSPDTGSKKWNFMKRIKTSPKLGKKSQSFDETTITEKDEPVELSQNKMNYRQNSSPLFNQDETCPSPVEPSSKPDLGGRSSPFTRAKLYSKRMNEVVTEAKSKRDSGSSDDSGIIVRNGEDDEDTKNSSHDLSPAFVNSAKTVFLVPPRCEITTLNRKISIDDQSKCRIKLSGEVAKNNTNYGATKNGMESNNLNNQGNNKHDNISTHLNNQDDKVNQNINAYKDANLAKLKTNRHFIQRPSLDASFHTSLKNNMLPCLTEHENPLTNDNLAFDQRPNGNGQATVTQLEPTHNSNGLRESNELMVTDKSQRVKELDDEISRHLKEIDDMFDLII